MLGGKSRTFDATLPIAQSEPFWQGEWIRVLKPHVEYHCQIHTGGGIQAFNSLRQEEMCHRAVCRFTGITRSLLQVLRETMQVEKACPLPVYIGEVLPVYEPSYSLPAQA